MSKIIVRKQEYANNGTHANEIEAVVQQNLIANTLSSATDIAPSVGLLKSIKDDLDSDVSSLNDSLSTTDGKFKTLNMFNKHSGTYTTSAAGNANITDLSADYVIFAVRGPVNYAPAFVARGSNGIYYVHITDSNGNAVANTNVALDIYYL